MEAPHIKSIYYKYINKFRRYIYGEDLDVIWHCATPPELCVDS